MSRPDPQETAQQWAEVGKHLLAARSAWAEVSPDSIGPVDELARSAQWNAVVWQHEAEGMSRSEASAAADAECGRAWDSRHIVYDPETDED